MGTTVTQPNEPEVVKNNEPEVDPETGKFVYVYQPRDAEGQFIGRPYRFLYTDHQDLVSQLASAKESGDRYIHEVKTGKRQVVGEAAKPQPEFKPAPESTEDADRKRREDFRKTTQEEFGADPETVRTTLRKATALEEGVTAYHWALNKQAHGYYPCPENGKSIIKWLDEKKLAHIPANYDLAFEELRDSLVKEPQEQTPAPPADSPQQPTATRAEAKPHSTGIMPGQFAGTRQPTRQDKQPLTADRFRQINKMSYSAFTALKRSNPDEYWAFVKMKEAKAQPQQ
jgi:hypothetical protein